MSSAGRRTAPPGLGDRGRGFWRKVQKEYELDVPEAELLIEVCRSMDDLEAMQRVVESEGRTVGGSRGQVVAHPLLVEVRQTRALLGRLVAQLGLPAEDAEPTPGTVLSPRQARAKRAAQVRWSSPRAERRRGTA